jgi:hypothetical protein
MEWMLLLLAVWAGVTGFMLGQAHERLEQAEQRCINSLDRIIKIVREL